MSLVTPIAANKPRRCAKSALSLFFFFGPMGGYAPPLLRYSTRGVKSFEEVRGGLYCGKMNGGAAFGKNDKFIIN